jgi:hypothetical protein
MEGIMRRDVLAAGAMSLLMTGMLLSGCSKSVTGPERSLDDRDVATMRNMILEDPLFTSDPYTLDDRDVVSFGSSMGKTASPIIPIAWGRRVTGKTLDTQFESVDDTTVVATVTHTIKGDVIILTRTSVRDSAVKITKPFTSVTVRKVKFYRQGRTGDPDRGWKPSEISGVKGGTESSQLTIKGMEVTVGNDTYTITEPTDYFFRLNRPGPRPLLTLGASQPVKVRLTLTSADPDTDWVSIHRPIMLLVIGPEYRVKALHVRMRLVSQIQAGALYERVFEYSWAGHVVGRHTVLVDAITRGSLYDDAAPFSTQIWGIPYVVQ